MIDGDAGKAPLHELLLERRTAILDRFVAASRAQGLPPEGATRQGILDHLHAFLGDMAMTLRREALGPSSSATPEGDAARVHGAQRWGVGYDLPDMVREYGVLRRCILESTSEAGVDLDLRSFDRIAELLNFGIAEAVDEFVRRKEEALRATREEALTIVAHDLRGPLQIIAGAVTLLRETVGEAADPRVQTSKLLDGVERATGTMNELIAGLLDLSRLEAGRLPLSKGDYEVSALLIEAAERARPLAERARLHIDVALSPPGMARCDRERTLQVLANLVGNAIKFTPPHGQVRLAAERVEGGWRLSVRDTGPGIPVEQRPLLFERFWQAPETRHQGTGLGLAIAKGLVEAQDGGIGVESEPGRGSVFFFTLPGASP
ncbi:MAG: HAMP domain-containing histidine kinase [Polyangiaceae bacterium]|jgi:signal transduction histidine kinase|nr:HAMP domain-containing histidine kinase [Polyangiaceae bacterium]